jgi:CheY-like chemotaxis protein
MAMTRHTILVAEDNEQWQEILQETLAEEGYEVRLVDTYASARNILETEEVDLLVLDLELAGSSPVLDGPRLLSHLRRIGCEVPCIIVSGQGTIPLVRQAFTEFAVKDFFEKGAFDLQAFPRSVELALQSSPKRHRNVILRDFDVTVSPPHGNAYPLNIRCPAGTGDRVLELSTPSEMQIRGDVVPSHEQARMLGGRLFDALFRDEQSAGEFYHRSQERLGENQVLRIKVGVDLVAHPELAPVAAWPWEYLYDSRRQEFLNLSAHSRLVRYVPVPESYELADLEAPLHVLVVSAQPGDLPSLDVEKEKSLIGQAVQGQSLTVSFLDHATRERLYDELHERPVHVIHFIGHGIFDRERQQGVLYIEDRNGRSDPVSGARLADLFVGERISDVRLIVLNACQTAVGDEHCPETLLHGIAVHLAMRGVPAVIGMRFPMSGRTALEFARQFYRDWICGYPICEAVSSARKKVHFQERAEGAEWGVPILFQSRSV